MIVPDHLRSFVEINRCVSSNKIECVRECPGWSDIGMLGIMSNPQKFKMIAQMERSMRRTINMVYSYRHTGVTRDDIAAKNKRAEAASNLMGELESVYLTGVVRSENAPSLPKKRAAALKKTAGDNASLDEMLEEAIS